MGWMECGDLFLVVALVLAVLAVRHVVVRGAVALHVLVVRDAVFRGVGGESPH